MSIKRFELNPTGFTKTDLQLSANNFLNVKTYNALYLSANTLTASSYTLPGRIILLKILVNL
jgi:hypothetical protein